MIICAIMYRAGEKLAINSRSMIEKLELQTLIEERRRPTGPGRDRMVVRIMTTCAIGPC
jgi:hypothetical protein